MIALFAAALLLVPPDSSRVPRQPAVAWRQDLAFLARELVRRHQNAFHAISRADFERAVKTLDERIPRLSNEQVVAGLARIVALIGDGHTRLPLDGVVRQYPLTLYRFAEGVYVRSAARPFAALVGGKLVAIGSAPAERVFAAVSELVGRDNPMTVASRTPPLMTSPELLHALGFAPSDDEASFTVERNGARVTKVVRRLDSSERWVDARDEATAPTPLWLEDPGNNYWFKYLTDSRTLYVQYNAVQNKADESVEAFFARVFQTAGTEPVDRMVIDLRSNGGGDGTLNWPLIYGLIRSDRLNQRGRLFVIIGRRTFSAAQNCVNALEKHTRAIFVGEPTGARPNSYGNAVEIDLPHSQLTALASAYYWQDVYPWDNRPWTAPSISAPLTIDDYRRNVDPAMDAILRYRPLSEEMLAAIEAQDVGRAIERYRAYRADPANAAIDTEIDVALAGDRLMKEHRVEEAVSIYRLNTVDHADSYLAWQNLGGAYLTLGQNDSARVAFRRSLELNPSNANTVTVLRILGRKTGEGRRK